MGQNPKIFISYTHDSKEHIDKVLEISNKLRSEGIDVVLDQYEQSPPQGWPKWMDQNINNAEFVLIICTENYYKSIMDEEKEGVGLGRKWEGRLIYQHLYQSGSKSKKFIPVLLKKEDIKFIPTLLQGPTHYLITEESDYKKLYWFLRGINPIERPELGKLRPLPKKEKKSIFVGGFIDIPLWDKAKWCATAFGTDPKLKEPPFMCLLFKEKEPAEEIMKKWLLRLGETDQYNELRVSIIEGDIPGEEPGYSIHISSNILNIIKRAEEEGIDIPKDVFLMISRLHRMTPEKDSRNLENFKELYERFGSYTLKVGTYDQGNIDVFQGLYLHKRNIEFRNVNDIKSKDDMDSVILPKYRNKKLDIEDNMKPLPQIEIKDSNFVTNAKNVEDATGMKVNQPARLVNVKSELNAENVRTAVGFSTNQGLSSIMILCGCGQQIPYVCTGPAPPSITCPHCGKEHKRK